jgi:hypothetical protein
MLVNGTERAAWLPHTLLGLGGVGKTHLAIEYVYRFANEYDLVCWLPGHDLNQVRESLVELGSALGLPGNPNVTRAAAATLDALRSGELYSRWLLVYDNADRPEDLQPFLPYPYGHVLEHMRTTQLGVTANRSVVGVMTEFARLAEIHHDADPTVDLVGLAVRLAATPCGPLYGRNVSPDRELAATVHAIA